MLASLKFAAYPLQRRLRLLDEFEELLEEELPELDEDLTALLLLDVAGRLLTAGRLAELEGRELLDFTCELPELLRTAVRLPELVDFSLLDCTLEERVLPLVVLSVLREVTDRRVSEEAGLATLVFSLGLLVGRRYTFRSVSVDFLRRSALLSRRV